MGEVLLPVLLGVLGVAIGGAVLGGFLIWALAQRAGIEPADVFDGYDREETAELRIEIPAPPVVATRPMSAMERLEGPTRWITIPSPQPERPWWYGGRHSVRDSRCRVPLYLNAPQGTLELPQVSVWPTGEYEVLGGAR